MTLNCALTKVLLGGATQKGRLPSWLSGKESSCQAGDMGWENPLEKEMSTHPSILAWEIPRTEFFLVGYSPCGHKDLDILSD